MISFAREYASYPSSLRPDDSHERELSVAKYKGISEVLAIQFQKKGKQDSFCKLGRGRKFPIFFQRSRGIFDFFEKQNVGPRPKASDYVPCY